MRKNIVLGGFSNVRVGWLARLMIADWLFWRRIGVVCASLKAM
jgi:hypothetical protein